MTEWVWCASSPSLLVTVISKAMSSSEGVITATPSSLKTRHNPKWVWVWVQSQVLLCLVGPTTVTAPSPLTWPVIWKHLGYFVFFWSRTCTVTVGYFDKYCLCHSPCSLRQSEKKSRTFLTFSFMDTHTAYARICTSESGLFCWKTLSTGVTLGRSALVLVVWLELNRDTVTETLILCSLSLISRWNRRVYILV